MGFEGAELALVPLDTELAEDPAVTGTKAANLARAAAAGLPVLSGFVLVPAEKVPEGTASAGGASGANGRQPITIGAGASGRRSSSRMSPTCCVSGRSSWGISVAVPRPSRVWRGEARKRSVAGR